MNTRWPNCYIPAFLAFVLASIIYSLATEAWAAWLGWLLGIVAFLPLFIAAVWVVGFAAGLVGIEPYDMTRQFGNGWDWGMTLSGRAGRLH